MRVNISMHVSLALHSHPNGVYISATNRFSRLLRPRFHQLRTVRFVSNRVHGVYNVPVGSNGHVSLSVVHPKLAPSHPGNVIIHLPSGPLFQSARLEGAGLSSPSLGRNRGEPVNTSHGVGHTTSARALADMTSSTVVTINYRLGELTVPEDSPRRHSDSSDTDLRKVTYRYPTPVHDTLTGLDWILETLQPNRLGVVGTHIGGSLALMLALTEPRYIHAVAALEPVCDWTSLDEFCTSSGASAGSSFTVNHRKKPHHAPSDLVPLLEARERFFANPGRYFDSFASPILFLRSAGKDVPKAWPRYLTGPEYPIPLLSKESEDSLDGEVELWDAYLPEDSDGGYESAETSSTADGKEQPLVRRRKTLARWPPYGLDYGTSGPRQAWSREPVQKLEITLPWVRVFTKESLYSEGVTSALEDTEPRQADETASQKPSSRRRRNQNATVLTRQANEMVDVMRRACFWGRESGFANERVSLVSLESLARSGLGESSPSASDEMMASRVGEWLVDALNATSGDG
ncbi:Alpha/Beta hydrolase protein [Aspergillus pseudodeflectus]|uniref:Alpha/Beta hydrolase protein n=1 Tax=Aspergillus pseudodeflectus TaxID=176178 RepID=A0ABR4KT78_9EURO